MTTITLEAVQTEQARLADLIEQLRKQRTVTEYVIPGASIELRAGEHYAGIVLDEDGNPSHHLILLPGSQADQNHEEAIAWAESIGGELPTRREQSLLFANLRQVFEGGAYWSAETHEDGSSFAWYQYVGDGDQLISRKSAQLRAVAVRRLVIQ